MKVGFVQPNGLTVYSDLTGNESISTHLKVSEVWNNSAKEEVKLICSSDFWTAVDCWEYLRTRYGKSITISSCYRTPTFNASVGGEANSLHLKGCAFDNQLGKMDNATFERWKGWVENACILYGVQAELGRYNWGLHTGFIKTLPYKYDGLVYTFDKR